MAKYDAMGDKVQRRVPIALWIMIIGLVICVSGIIWCLNTNLKKYVKTENLSNDRNMSGITEIDIDIEDADTVIKKSPDDMLHVTVENAPEKVYKIGTKDGRFYIKRKVFSLNAVRVFGVSKIPFLKDLNAETKVTILVPDKDYEKIEIDNGIGEMSISDLRCDTLEIDNGVGEIEVSRVSANNTDIDNGVGEITCSDCTFGRTQIDNGVGDVTVEDSEMTDTDIDNGIGDVNIIKTAVRGDIEIDNGIGDTVISIKGSKSDYRYKKNKDKDAKYVIDIDDGIGDVRISYVD